MVKRILTTAYEAGSDLASVAAATNKYDRSRYIKTARNHAEVIRLDVNRLIHELEELMQLGFTPSGAFQAISGPLPSQTSTVVVDSKMLKEFEDPQPTNPGRPSAIKKR
jgi:hypothetical protein